MPEHHEIPTLLAKAELGAKIIDVSERKFHELRHTPDFPKPVLLSPRCVRWRIDDLVAYVNKLQTVAALSEPAQLRHARETKASQNALAKSGASKSARSKSA